MQQTNELSLNDFNKGIQDGVVMVDFNAPWCGPCRALEPVINQLEEQYAQKAKVLQVNIDNAREVAMHMGIQSIPTIVVFKQGQERERFVGVQNAQTLKDALDGAIEG